MLRAAIGLLFWWGVVSTVSPVCAQGYASLIIPEPAALQQGLHRAWATQIEVDPARGRVAYLALEGDIIVAQTDQGTVHVIDAETRATRWVAHIGQPNYPTTIPAANDEFVAATNGSRLFLMDRHTGEILWRKRLDGMPNAGPALAKQRAYIPLTSGVLMSFLLPDLNPSSEEINPLEKLLKDTPLSYRATGMADAPPTISGSHVVWGTQKGFVYAAELDGLVGRFRFKCKDAVTARVSHRSPFVYAASRDGYVYALHEERGYARWQFSVGEPVVEQPVLVGDRLFVIPETGGLFCISADDGQEQWSIGGVRSFVSASPTRLYVADRIGRLLVLDRKTGARMGSLATERLPIKVVNTQTDRIYLCTTGGLLQCLHEEQLTTPVKHEVPEAKEEPAAKGAKGKAAPKDGEGEDEGEKPEEDAGPDPFDDAAPAEDGDAEMPADGDEGDAAEGDAAEEGDAEEGADAEMAEDEVAP